MSNRQATSETRTIHPRALVALGESVCVEMLGVARDLRSGVIPRKKFNQGVWYANDKSWCGSACCIAGHVAHRTLEIDFARTGAQQRILLAQIMDWEMRDSGVSALFCGCQPSDPLLAADAIERFVLRGSGDPRSTT